MSCPSQCSAELSQYEQHCCNISNYGQTFAITEGGRHHYILCPTTQPQQCMPPSCSDVSNNGGAISGYYDIMLANGSTASVYCNMEGCDGEGGWTRVAYLNMSQHRYYTTWIGNSVAHDTFAPHLQKWRFFLSETVL